MSLHLPFFELSDNDFLCLLSGSRLEDHCLFAFPLIELDDPSFVCTLSGGSIMPFDSYKGNIFSSFDLFDSYNNSSDTDIELMLANIRFESISMYLDMDDLYACSNFNMLRVFSITFVVFPRICDNYLLISEVFAKTIFNLIFLAFTETRLDSASEQLYRMPQYLICNSMNASGGGVCLYIKNV